MKSRNELLKNLGELQQIVEENEILETRCAIMEQLLISGNVFSIVFDQSLKIIFQNFPSKVESDTLAGFAFLLGRKNINTIQGFVTKAKRDESLHLQHREINFRLTPVLEEYWSIQIHAFEATLSESNTEVPEMQEELSDKYSDFEQLTKILEDIKDLKSQKDVDDAKGRIQQQYMPLIVSFKESVDDPTLKICLEIIEQNIAELLGAETESEISQEIYSLLTPSEMQIAKFIRMGKTTKEIANTLSIAAKTVENHRNNLRNKLGIRNKGVNLRTYLIGLSKQGE